MINVSCCLSAAIEIITNQTRWFKHVKGRADYFQALTISEAKIAPNFGFNLPKARDFGGLEAFFERHLATEICVLTFLKEKPTPMFFKVYYKHKALKNEP